ncbi:MAG: hydrogenase maturation nickel metallochaperone HypA [Chitinophagales bacterium]|nr:hydrogenase maturation nickel metallochaperone HypA [Chitinophagales bacterium]
MHEISLVRTIFRTLEAEFPAAGLDGLERIELKVGPLSNVETILLQNAFNAVVEEEEQRFQGVQLQVNLVPILIECPECGQRTEVENYRFVCQCGRPCANVVQGNELMIERVVFKS